MQGVPAQSGTPCISHCVRQSLPVRAGPHVPQDSQNKAARLHRSPPIMAGQHHL